MRSSFCVCTRPNKKKISLFQVTGLKILGRVGTHIFFWKKNNLCILKGEMPFKIHKIVLVLENL